MPRNAKRKTGSSSASSQNTSKRICNDDNASSSCINRSTPRITDVADNHSGNDSPLKRSDIPTIVEAILRSLPTQLSHGTPIALATRLDTAGQQLLQQQQPNQHDTPCQPPQQQRNQCITPSQPPQQQPNQCNTLQSLPLHHQQPQSSFIPGQLVVLYIHLYIAICMIMYKKYREPLSLPSPILHTHTICKRPSHRTRPASTHKYFTTSARNPRELYRKPLTRLLFQAAVWRSDWGWSSSCDTKVSRQNPVWGICRYVRTVARSIGSVM